MPRCLRHFTCRSRYAFTTTRSLSSRKTAPSCGVTVVRPEREEHVMEPQDLPVQPVARNSETAGESPERSGQTPPPLSSRCSAARAAPAMERSTALSVCSNLRERGLSSALARGASQGGFVSYRTIKAILERTAKPREAPELELQQHAPEIRPVADYQAFWDLHARRQRQRRKRHEWQ